MKTKLRNIVVDGHCYKWRIDFDCDGDGGRWAKIWKDKNTILVYEEIDYRVKSITPKFIRKLIEDNT